MSLINLRNITIGHGSFPLIEDANLTVTAKERVCLIGRNGVGKTTLLRMIQGEIAPDKGSIEKTQNLKISFLQQMVPRDLKGSVSEIVAAGLENGEEEWQQQTKVSTIISRLGLDGDFEFSRLSGGLKRRVLLARALVSDPDVLILDEPTNHLDIKSIEWLENFLLGFQKTLIFVTHDRYLMQKIGNHFVEIDNGKVYSWRGKYEDYISLREERLDAEARADSLFDKRLAEEEKWIRQGIKARRTRNEGRVRQLKKMRDQRALRRTRLGKVAITQGDMDLSGKIVFDVNDLNYSHAHHAIIKNFSTQIQRGDKVGVIGANGSGKSTLIKLLLQKLQPDSGTVKTGTNLTIGYFDQDRIELDENKTVIDNVSALSDMIDINGVRIHIISYLKDFLFSPEKSRTLVRNLSGGEKNRVMLAKLFSKAANLLVLDEPTNDLDIETLELLEEQLVSYEGTVLLISHDRAFLNNIVTNTLGLEGDGEVDEYVGGYDDYLRQRKIRETPSTQATAEIKNAEKSKTAKLSYKEQRELEGLHKKIEELEAEQSLLQTKLSDPNFFKNAGEEMLVLTNRLAELEAAIFDLYSRWEILENKK